MKIGSWVSVVIICALCMTTVGDISNLFYIDYFVIKVRCWFDGEEAISLCLFLIEKFKFCKLKIIVFVCFDIVLLKI